MFDYRNAYKHNEVTESRNDCIHYMAFSKSFEPMSFTDHSTGEMLDVNQAYLDLFGFQKEEVIGKSTIELGIFVDDEVFNEGIKLVQNNGYLHNYPVTLRTKTGLLKYGLIFCNIIHYSGRKIRFTILNDQTERIKYQNELRDNEEYFRIMIENISDIIGITDKDGTIIYRSPNNETIFGMKPEEVIGQNAFNYIHPDDQARLKYEFQRIVNGGDNFLTNGEFRYQCKDGSYKDILLTGKNMLNNNLINGVLISFKDITEISMYKDELEKSNSKLAHKFQQSINAISKIGELRDMYTAGHQRKVQELSCAIALELGLSSESVYNISLGALVHDIGKIYISSDTLNKPGKLTNLEYEILKTHAAYGYNVAKEIDFPWQIPAMIHQHHERLDGTGYPQGLAGDQIIIESRILAVADVVEAMSSHRPYRPALGIDAALEEISKNSGIKYDKEVVDACICLFREKHFVFTIC